MPGTLATFRRQLSSLSAIKDDLGKQARELLPRDMTEIRGLVEIGYPGRFIQGFKDHYKVSGKIVAVNEGEQISDYVQTGFPRPYNKHAELNYAAPNLATLGIKVRK